eukprot:1158756-Pelagomonas_calceolata.AAC.23
MPFPIVCFCSVGQQHPKLRSAVVGTNLSAARLLPAIISLGIGLIESYERTLPAKPNFCGLAVAASAHLIKYTLSTCFPLCAGDRVCKESGWCLEAAAAAAAAATLIWRFYGRLEGGLQDPAKKLHL